MDAIRTVIVGTNENVPYLLRSLNEMEGCNVVGLIADSDSKLSDPQLDEISDVETHTTSSLNTTDSKQFLRQRRVDVAICFGWYEVVDSSVLSLPTHGILGIHAAPLPTGRGHAPVNWQIILGFDRATTTIYKLTEGIDAGEIYAQQSVPILTGESVESLYERLSYFSIDAVQSVIQDIHANEASPRPQSRENATYWPSRRQEDGLLDWKQSAPKLSRLTRALSGRYPRAFTYYKQARVEIERAKAVNTNTHANPGEVVSVTPPESLSIQTSDGSFIIQRINRRDEPSITGSEFAKKYGIQPGETFGTAAHFPPRFCYTGLRGAAGRTDLLVKTNASVGDTVINHAYCFFPRKKEEVRITASIDNLTVLDDEFDITGHQCVPIEFTPTEAGDYFLDVQFSTGNENTCYIYVD